MSPATTAALVQPRQRELFDPVGEAGAGIDIDGDRYCVRVGADARRAEGITLTPAWLVERMCEQAKRAGDFDTVVDAGAGSGRFTIAAAAHFPRARVVAIERHAELAAVFWAHRLDDLAAFTTAAR